MSDVRAAYDPNRLPWLNDTDGERGRRSTGSRGSGGWGAVVLWGVLALILVAAGGYWVGMRSVAQIEAEANTESWSSEATAVLPQPRADAAAPPLVEPAPVQELQPVAPPPVVRMTEPQPLSQGRKQPADRMEPAPAPTQSPARSEDSAVAEPATTAAPQAIAPPAVAKPAPLTLWPADVSEGAAGRAVRIGTFPTRLGAKRAWSRIVRVYPGMKRLKAVVVPVPSVRNGRTYYRLQFGTTSQAHSAVLCQRMRIVGQSCVVIGTPAA